MAVARIVVQVLSASMQELSDGFQCTCCVNGAPVRFVCLWLRFTPQQSQAPWMGCFCWLQHKEAAVLVQAPWVKRAAGCADVVGHGYTCV